MKGWKTWTGFGLVAGGAVMAAFGIPLADTAMTAGAGLMGVGIAHKVEKWLGPMIEGLQTLQAQLRDSQRK